MERNLLLAVSLSLLVYLGWYALLDRYIAPAPPSRPARTAEQAQAPTAAPASTAAPATPAPQARQPASVSSGLDSSLRYHVGRLELRIQPQGAGIVSFRYPGPVGMVELVHDPEPGFFSTWPELAFKPAPAGRPGAPADAKARRLAFEATHPSGVSIRKEYRFPDGDDVGSLTLTVRNPGKAPALLPAWRLSLGPGLGTVVSEEAENAKEWSAAVLRPPVEGRTVDQFESIKLKAGEERQAGPWRWFGVHNRYFLAAVFPPAGAFSAFWAGGAQKAGALRPWVEAEAAPLRLAPGSETRVEVPFYLGPKGFLRLEKLGLGLERSVKFGWFHRLGRGTLKVLHFFHGLTGNWGWAILLLTLSLQVVLFPLTFKSLKATTAMRRIQPEVARVQQKFGKDPQRMNQELMELYKKHGANPLGGCLPILVQMPVFVALFNMLRGAWELHGAPWILWIKDLSAHDPYYALPIAMGAVMFFQSKLNPAPSPDPVQAKIFTYMPLIFTFMFLNFPAGLVLYWLTNSLLSLAQQMALKDRLS